MSSRANASDGLTISRAALRRIGLMLGSAILLVVVVLVILAIARNIGGQDSLAAGINSSEYQAVFLTNNGVYFGKMTSPGGDFYYLRHVCYLQSASQRGGGQVPVLKKLTSDYNTPEDLIIVNRMQIRFVENLNPSGRAAQILAHDTCVH